MVCSEFDYFVFYGHSTNRKYVYLVVYVNDIVINNSDQEGISQLKDYLVNGFQTKDLCKLKYFWVLK